MESSSLLLVNIRVNSFTSRVPGPKALTHQSTEPQQIKLPDARECGFKRSAIHSGVLLDRIDLPLAIAANQEDRAAQQDQTGTDHRGANLRNGAAVNIAALGEAVSVGA
jgi:hypothetical protein